jgi:type IV pilus assembly protein PilB
MVITPEIRDMIVRAASTAEIRAMAQSQGMKTLRQAGLLKVLEGTTTIEEILRVTVAD